MPYRRLQRRNRSESRGPAVPDEPALTAITRQPGHRPRLDSSHSIPQLVRVRTPVRAEMTATRATTPTRPTRVRAAIPTTTTILPIVTPIALPSSSRLTCADCHTPGCMDTIDLQPQLLAAHGRAHGCDLQRLPSGQLQQHTQHLSGLPRDGLQPECTIRITRR
jgi:hypothetical protein